MPKIFELSGKIAIKIRTHDHEPPHVHVVAPDRRVIINIEDLAVRKNSGFSESDIKFLKQFVRARREKLMRRWNEIHRSKEK